MRDVRYEVISTLTIAFKQLLNLAFCSSSFPFFQCSVDFKCLFFLKRRRRKTTLRLRFVLSERKKTRSRDHRDLFLELKRKSRRRNFARSFCSSLCELCIIQTISRLAQSAEHETLNLGVMGSSPMLGVDFFVNFFCILWRSRKSWKFNYLNFE